MHKSPPVDGNILPRSEFQWSMKLQCGNCGEVTPNFVYFTADDEEEVNAMVMRTKRD